MVSCNTKKPVYYTTYLNREIMTEHGFAGEKLILKENNNKFFLERIILGSGRPVIEKTTNEIKIEISGNSEKIETVFYSNALKKSAKIEIRLNEKGIEILYDNVQSRISYIK
jgi:hypothetical protein